MVIVGIIGKFWLIVTDMMVMVTVNDDDGDDYGDDDGKDYGNDGE
jgi:hypothetical protein